MVAPLVKLIKAAGLPTDVRSAIRYSMSDSVEGRSLEQLLRTVANAFRSARNLGALGLKSKADIEGAAALLRAAGYGVTAPGVRPPPVQRPGQGRGGGRRPPTRPPTAPAGRDGGDPGRGGNALQPVGRRDLAGAPPRPGEQSPYGQEILTPQSSNVFAFSFALENRTRGVLYVTFKAGAINPDSITKGKGRRGGRDQLHGSSGATVRGKSNSRGPMYAYFDVKAEVFERMKTANSKGKFVWDALRVRGSIHGHQYAYKLVQAQIVTGNVSGEYVPRKATASGFRVRSVANLGTGRRGFVSSTLPSTSFSSLRSRGR